MDYYCRTQLSLYTIKPGLAWLVSPLLPTASVFVITADDIRRSGATSLAEVLRLAPNLQVARANAPGQAALYGE